MSPPANTHFQSLPYAASYARWYQSRRGERIARQEQALLETLLARRFSQATTALELGCGTGVFTEWLQARGIRSTGVELSAAMLAARVRPAQAHYVQGDAVRLPFGPAQFDLAVVVAALEFFVDPRAALREAARVARQGVLLGVLNRWSWMAIRRRLAGWFSDSVFRNARFYSRSDLRRLLADTLGGQVSDLETVFAAQPALSPFLALAAIWT